ncbi:hypothetical protein WJX72_007032 [[Myrmecia] bisecta]|uniref:Uncharacterized protein n=1 Tax=[Myrmecia] bisecta TaxID=41462 RepID=A0AAW1QRE1_9CHLO
MLLAVYTVAATAGALAAVTGVVAELRKRSAAQTGNQDARVEQAQPAQGKNGSASSPSNAALVVTILLALMGVMTGLSYTGVLHKLPWLRSGSVRACGKPAGSLRIAPYGDLFGFEHPIITSSSTAQQLFNLGMLQEWNYNQEEALHAFQQAAAEDPTAAMPYWGQTYALGPGANRAVVPAAVMYPAFTPDDFPACFEAAQMALTNAKLALEKQPDLQLAQKELAYAEAAVKRFAKGSERQPQRDAAEQAYAAAMRDIGYKYADQHALAIAAESYMNLSPWDYYEDGVLRPTAEVAEKLLREVLEIEPLNPLALHLHIHIAEAASPLRDTPVTAARAEASADAMTSIDGVHNAHLGHLIHMPSHTYVRIGRYHDAVEANIRAWAADYWDNQHCRNAYIPEHNMDLLVYAAGMAGQFETAKLYSQRLRTFNEDMPSSSYSNTYYWVHLVTTYIMYAQWEDILAIKAVPHEARALCMAGGYEYALVVFHYARTLALAAKAAELQSRAPGAQQAQQAQRRAEEENAKLKAAATDVVEEEKTYPGPGLGIYSCEHRRLTDIYVHMADARIAWLRSKQAKAEAVLQAAAELEDQLAYMEPPRLFQPVRQCWGHVLLNATKPGEAQQVFEQDLARNPRNGWSLFGLVRSLEAQGKPCAAQREDLNAAWAHADAPLTSSCASFAL